MRAQTFTVKGMQRGMKYMQSVFHVQCAHSLFNARCTKVALHTVYLYRRV